MKTNLLNDDKKLKRFQSCNYKKIVYNDSQLTAAFYKSVFFQQPHISAEAFLQIFRVACFQ